MASQPGEVDTRFNPIAANPFRTRKDVQEAVISLFGPLLPSFSPGKARVQVDASTSTWDRAACDLEGFARPLFGLAPLAAGGESFEHWKDYRTGLANGTDPSHPEYWGAVPPHDQRHVEAAALAYAILLVPQHIWTPLPTAAKQNVADWLLSSRNGAHGSNNHKFFRILVDLALESVGVDYDANGTEEYLQDMESLYMSEGWYRDGDDAGDTRRIDYYNAFAMHYYGLFYAVHRPSDMARAARFKERAATFAPAFLHWFADTGANVPYGRSLAYRQCVAAFWGQLAVAGVEALPWGVIKGVYLRNLRWWAAQPVARRDGVLSLGYAYPNHMAMERYLAGGSPYWCMKAFAPLSLPAEHPFWTAPELPMPPRPSIAAFAVPGLVFAHQPGHTVMLVSGPGTKLAMRHVPEKYQKFAYSSRYGFSVESDPLGFDVGAFDSMLALSDDDGAHYRVREHCDSARLAGNILFSSWRPWSDVLVHTWLVPHENGRHARVHRVASPRRLITTEGAFAAPRADFALDEIVAHEHEAWVHCMAGDFVGIRDCSPTKRAAKVTKPHGSTSLMFPRTLVPQLKGIVTAAVPQVFACVIVAGPDGDSVKAQWTQPPHVPEVEVLERLVEEHSLEVDVVKQYERQT